MFTKCKLYNIKRKKDLLYLLFGKDKYDYRNINKYNVFIDINNPAKPRLVEHAYKESELKRVQYKLYSYLTDVDLPDYLFSKKGSSSVDNAKYHINNQFAAKIDISGFFPNSHRNYIYKMFEDDMKCSPDVSKILTDLTTINLKEYLPNTDIDDYICKKKIRTLNHLPTGSSTSPILCFLAYRNMFEEIYRLAKARGYTMSVYVDDITFSANQKIDRGFIKTVAKIINKYGHRINNNKTIYYTKNEFKTITGVVIKNSKAYVPSRIDYSIYALFTKLNEQSDYSGLANLMGKLNYARILDKSKYPNLFRHIKSLFKTR